MRTEYTGVNTYVLEILRNQFKKDKPDGTEEEFKAWVQEGKDMCELMCFMEDD